MKALIILTLKQHESGVWIRCLVQALEETKPIHEHADDERRRRNVSIQVVALEDLLQRPLLVTERPLFPVETTIGIVNRISDAASPVLFKAALAVLQAARLQGLPIFNGPTVYSLCANKWCHHVLFQQAQLKSPATAVYMDMEAAQERSETVSSSNPSSKTEATTLRDQFQTARDLVTSRDAKHDGVLIKPNAGGFGAGIQHVPASTDATNLVQFPDGMTLVQAHHAPSSSSEAPPDMVYRVWFLLGQIQCAVQQQRRPQEFTAYCAGDTCSIAKAKAWSVSVEVRTELEEQLLPLLPDAHCGSVEFLVDSKGVRLYIDLNLLSTLPINVDNQEKVWTEAYEPWRELADAVWKVTLT